MSPLDQILATDWTPFVLGVCLVALVFWVRRQVRNFHRPEQPPRQRPEPVEEIDLADAIQDFIGGRGLTRTAVAFARSNNEAAVREHPASRTKEIDSYATRQ